MSSIREDILNGTNCFIKENEQVCVYGSKEDMHYRDVLLAFKDCIEYYGYEPLLKKLSEVLGVTVIITKVKNTNV